jgi:hypothetical protein
VFLTPLWQTITKKNIVAFLISLWIYTPLSRLKLFASEKHAIILVLAIAVVLRATPELVAYPYPIGYDVVNYYIPVVANFDAHWPTVSSQFPLYVLFLHFVGIAIGLQAHSVVTGVAVAMFGLFGIALFYLSRSLLKLHIGPSIFLSLFVLFQMAVLRTAWDLHRDIFALTGMLFVFCLLDRKDAGWKRTAVILVLAACTVASDRMIGALFCTSLVAYAIMTFRRDIIATCILATGLFSFLMVASYSASNTSISYIETLPEKTPVFYNSQNLLILFAVVNGLIVVPAAIGYLRMKNKLLKVPLLVSLAGSFSWLLFPEINLLVADRWIIMSGIFLSIFGGYGIAHTVKNLTTRHSATIAGSVLAAFAAIGLAYAVMPYDKPFIMYGIVRGNIEDFGPVTMQFNSLDIQDNDKLLSAIAWINQNTNRDAVIVGEKHWRGVMELYLEDERTYRFSDNPEILAGALERGGENVYLIGLDGSSPAKFTIIEEHTIR